jgi:hypothetical protein
MPLELLLALYLIGHATFRVVAQYIGYFQYEEMPLLQKPLCYAAHHCFYDQ